MSFAQCRVRSPERRHEQNLRPKATSPKMDCQIANAKSRGTMQVVRLILRACISSLCVCSWLSTAPNLARGHYSSQIQRSATGSGVATKSKLARLSESSTHDSCYAGLPGRQIEGHNCLPCDQPCQQSVASSCMVGEVAEDEAVGGVRLEEGRKHQGLHGHQLDEDVQGGAGGVLQRVAHGVAHDCSLVAVGALSAQRACSLGGSSLPTRRAVSRNSRNQAE